MFSRCCLCFKLRDQTLSTAPEARLHGVSRYAPDQLRESIPPHKAPIIVEKDRTGQLVVKNPSMLSKSEYKQNPAPLFDNPGDKVSLIHIACDHDIQQADG